MISMIKLLGMKCGKSYGLLFCNVKQHNDITSLPKLRSCNYCVHTFSIIQCIGLNWYFRWSSLNLTEAGCSNSLKTFNEHLISHEYSMQVWYPLEYIIQHSQSLLLIIWLLNFSKEKKILLKKKKREEKKEDI